MTGRAPSGQAGQASPGAAKASPPSGDHPSRDDYSTLDMADLHYAARVLEELAVAVAREGAGRKHAEAVDLGAQAVRLAIEIIDDLYKAVCDSDGSDEAGETHSGSTEGDSAGPQDIAQGPAS